MKNRTSFFGQYLQTFHEEYDKVLADFSVEDKIYITTVLIATVQAYKQQPVDSDKVNALYEELLKKYGNQLRTYSNAHLSDYLQPESLKHVDLQIDMKVENAGEDENFFTIEEQQHFLDRVESLLTHDKQQYYLLDGSQTEIDTKNDKEAELSGKEEKNKAFTARRRALAIHYLDKHLKINPTGNKQLLAEFAHFLTGNTYDKIYRTLRNPLGYNTDSVKKKAEESLREDLKYIRSYFVRLELPEVVKYIDNDIGSIE